jgi:ppGpp synthetase/RelA/SpoT-type nucleotidyltranferase
MTRAGDDLHQEWNKLTDRDWVAVHVPRFVEIRPRYQAYEEFLSGLLTEACSKLAPLAIVQTRTKDIPSFAEKILRKRKRYTNSTEGIPPDPLARITDLCGGRVVTQTADQVLAVCKFIEETLEVDTRNSEDVSQRLKSAEFGYRSVHYVVLVNPEQLKAAGIKQPVPAEIIGLKGEVQVRTLLEHAWADIAHQLAYKPEIKVPESIQRQCATLAAVLEQVDHEFGRLVQGLEQFKSNFGAYLPRQQVETEIARLRIVLAHRPDDLEQVVKLAHLAISIGQYETALEILTPYRDLNHQGVQRALGLTLCEIHCDYSHSKDYLEGRTFLERACAHPKKDAETLCALAESWAPSDPAKARDLFRQAAAADATEPLTLCRYLEFEIDHSGNGAIIPLAAPMIRNAMQRCRREIEARVNLPSAWVCLGVFHLLIQEPYESLWAIAQVIRLCDPNSQGQKDITSSAETPTRPCASGRALQRILNTLQRLQGIQEQLPGFDWLQRLVLLGLAVQVKDQEALESVRKLASWDGTEPHLGAAESILILAGGCAPKVQGAVDALKPHLIQACEGLSLTIISGGIKMGMCGLAGDVAKQSAGRIRAFGYLPRSLPRDARQDNTAGRFAKLISTPGTDFTPLDPLQGWVDLVASGVNPRRVKLLGYAGGRVARTEYVVALALGARVGVIEGAALPKERQFNNPAWLDHRNFIRLPLDRMTLRAFLLVDELPSRRVELESAARHAHEKYVKSATPKEPSLLPWDDLEEVLKLSNFHQVAYAENILRTAGLGIRKISNPDAPLLRMQIVLGESGVRRLAEMEHGRWNVERFLLGWRYAETKDVAKKLSPYLVPWDKLSPEIQQYDVDAVLSLPSKFREASLEIYRLTDPAPGLPPGKA